MSETTNTTPDPAAAATPPSGVPSAEGAQPAGDVKPAPSPAGDGDVLDKAPDGEAQQQPAEDVLAGADDLKQEGVPDQYTFDVSEDLKAAGIEVDEAALNGFMETAKEVGLSQAQFQKLVEYDLQRTQAANTEAVDAWNERVNGWREAARTDKEFGGPNFDANVTTALSAVEKFADAEFKALLKSPSEQNPEGLAIGNHPAVLRFLNRIGKMLGDPSLVQGSEAANAADANEARMKRLYPSMFKESA